MVKLNKSTVKKLALNAAVLFSSLSGTGQMAQAQKTDAKSSGKSSLPELYANAKIANPNIRFPSYEDVCNELNKISLEEAAWDRTAFVFNSVVSTMNKIAAKGVEVWNNPKARDLFVKEIMKEVTGRKFYAASCIATGCYSVLNTLYNLSDDAQLLPDNKIYGNAFLADKKIKKSY